MFLADWLHLETRLKHNVLAFAKAGVRGGKGQQHGIQYIKVELGIALCFLCRLFLCIRISQQGSKLANTALAGARTMFNPLIIHHWHYTSSVIGNANAVILDLIM